MYKTLKEARYTGLASASIRGKSSKSGTVTGLIGHGTLLPKKSSTPYGSANLDHFGEHLLDYIKKNLFELMAPMGKSKELPLVDPEGTIIGITKDPEKGESIKVRKIRLNVRFTRKLDLIWLDNRAIKRKIIDAVQAGKVDYNENYNEYLTISDLTNINECFKYGNDGQSMYFIFRVEESELFNKAKKQIIVHKASDNIKESFDKYGDNWENFFNLYEESSNKIKESHSSEWLQSIANENNIEIYEIDYYSSDSRWAVVLNTENDYLAEDFRDAVGEYLGVQNSYGASYDDIEGMGNIHIGKLSYAEWSEIDGDTYDDLREDIRDKIVVFACPKQNWIDFRRFTDF